MKAHKYWSIGAIVTMVGTFYTGYKGLKAAHKYFAFGSLICLIMAVYSNLLNWNFCDPKVIKIFSFI